MALRLEVQNWRWADVPFYLRTGKRLPRRATEIAIQFKQPPLMLFRESASDPEPNLLAMRIQPDEGILLRFAAKVPELGLDVRSVNMDFTYGSSFLTDAPEAYETLLLDAMLGRRLAVHARRRGRGRVGHRHAAASELWQEWGAGGGERQGAHDEAARTAAADRRRRAAASTAASSPTRRGPGGRRRRTGSSSGTDGDGGACRRPIRHSSETPARGAGTSHTESIRGTTEALSRLWVRVAQEAAQQRRARRRRRPAPIARGDPRLAAPARRPTGEGVARADAHERADAGRRGAAPGDRWSARWPRSRCSRLAHPSRAIILSPIDPDGPATFDAHVYAVVPGARARQRREICTEEILLKVGGELAQHLASTVAPLLIHDLPVVLWWPDDVPFGRHDFVELASETDRLLVDSGHFRGDGRERLRGHGRRPSRGGLVVHDVSWMRLMLWRELLASLFDHPLLLPELQAPHGHPRRRGAAGRRRCDWRGRSLFVGWLMAQLRLASSSRSHERGDGTWTATLRSGRREIAVVVRPVEVEYSGAARSAGSLVRAELEASRGPRPTRSSTSPARPTTSWPPPPGTARRWRVGPASSSLRRDALPGRVARPDQPRAHLRPGAREGRRAPRPDVPA